MTDYSFYGLVCFSFLVVSFTFYLYLKREKDKIDTRNREIAIAHNLILSFEKLTDKLITNDFLPDEAKNLLLFISYLLTDDKEAESFLNYFRKTIDDGKTSNNANSLNANSLYEQILLRSKGSPEVLDDFNTAVRIGITAVMFKCPHQSRLYYEALLKPLSKTSTELDTIEKYKNNSSFKQKNSALPAC